MKTVGINASKRPLDKTPVVLLLIVSMSIASWFIRGPAIAAPPDLPDYDPPTVLAPRSTELPLNQPLVVHHPAPLFTQPDPDVPGHFVVTVNGETAAVSVSAIRGELSTVRTIAPVVAGDIVAVVTLTETREFTVVPAVAVLASPAVPTLRTFVKQFPPPRSSEASYEAEVVVSPTGPTVQVVVFDGLETQFTLVLDPILGDQRAIWWGSSEDMLPTDTVVVVFDTVTGRSREMPVGRPEKCHTGPLDAPSNDPESWPDTGPCLGRPPGSGSGSGSGTGAGCGVGQGRASDVWRALGFRIR